MTLLALLVLFLFLCALVYAYAAMAVSSFWGIPFVPTSGKASKKIWNSLPIHESDFVIDLGCGDGSVLFYVNRYFKSTCLGIEINPLLHWWNTIRSNKKVTFKRESMYESKLSDATIVYCFLFPEALVKLKQKFISECKAGTILVSHGFRIHGWEGSEWLIRNEGPFRTYFYQFPVSLPQDQVRSQEKQ